MDKNNNDDFKIILKLSYSELTKENNFPEFYLHRPKLRKLYTFNGFDEITEELCLKYFKIPKPTLYPINLDETFGECIMRYNQNQSCILNNVIKFILESKENIIQQNYSDKPQTSESYPLSEVEKSPLSSKRKLVLTHRGLIARAMTIPYRLIPSEYNDSRLYAIRYGGILHLVDPVVIQDHETIKNPRFWKFAQICFSNDPDLEPVTDVPVDRNDTIFGIFRSALQEFNLIYSAELPGVISEHKIDDIHNLDELGKCKFIQTKLLKNTCNILKHNKCLSWWAQSYLTNTNDICIALTKTSGVVRTPAQLIRVQDLPKNQKWKPSVCVRFLHTFLTLIEETMSKVNCPYTVYEFTYDSYAKSIKLKIHDGKTDFSFLPEDYIKHCKNQINFK